MGDTLHSELTLFGLSIECTVSCLEFCLGECARTPHLIPFLSWHAQTPWDGTHHQESQRLELYFLLLSQWAWWFCRVISALQHLWNLSSGDLKPDICVQGKGSESGWVEVPIMEVWWPSVRVCPGSQLLAPRPALCWEASWSWANQDSWSLYHASSASWVLPTSVVIPSASKWCMLSHSVVSDFLRPLGL